MNTIINNKILFRSAEKGFAIPLTLIAVMILMIMSMTILSLGLNARIYAMRIISDISARDAADAGLNKARYEIYQKILGQDWFDELPAEVNMPLTNCDAEYDYTVSLNDDGDYIIESIGSSGINRRMVRCVIEKRRPFDYAVFSNEDITLNNASTVDWYNYSDGQEYLSIGTNSTERDSIKLDMDTTINGDIMVGSGGDPDDIIKASMGAIVEGDMYSSAQVYEYELPVVPEWLDSLPSGGVINNTTIISNSGKYDSIKIKNGKKITITDEVELYITGDFDMDILCELEIEEGASLTLYLDGSFICGVQCNINNMTEIPKNLQIYGLENCDEIRLKNSSDFYGVLYTPNADIIIDYSVILYGSFVSNSFTARNSATVMYDASLRDEILSGEPVSYIMTRWSESQ